MIVYGASGHGKVIIEILEDMDMDDIVLWDDATTGSIWDYPIVKPHTMDDGFDEQIVIAIGVNSVRKKVVEKLSDDTDYAIAIHPSAIISKRAMVGDGTVVMAGATINADTTVGKHCIINTSASIDHDCVLDDYVHISPNATLSGIVTVGEGAHIGAGASVIQNIKIGKWCTIGAGAVVINDIPDYATAAGCPAKVIKIKNEQ